MSHVIRTLHSFCPHSETEAECQLVSRPVTIEFQGKAYHTTEEFARCPTCGGEFDVLGLRDPLKEVYEAYRHERGFPTAAQIVELRERLQMSPAQFALMLNTSKTTVLLYERGALPSESHGQALMTLCSAHHLLAPPSEAAVRGESVVWNDSAPRGDWSSRPIAQSSARAGVAPDVCSGSENQLITAA